MHDRAPLHDATNDSRTGRRFGSLDQSLATGLRHAGGSGRAAAAGGRSHRLPCNRTLSWPGTKLGKRDDTHDRFSCCAGAELGARLTGRGPVVLTAVMGNVRLAMREQGTSPCERRNASDAKHDARAGHKTCVRLFPGESTDGVWYAI